jgi:hypothetical protein
MEIPNNIKNITFIMSNNIYKVDDIEKKLKILYETINFIYNLEDIREYNFYLDYYIDEFKKYKLVVFIDGINNGDYKKEYYNNDTKLYDVIYEIEKDFKYNGLIYKDFINNPKYNKRNYKYTDEEFYGLFIL